MLTRGSERCRLPLPGPEILPALAARNGIVVR
jgi:hypothetical protein